MNLIKDKNRILYWSLIVTFAILYAATAFVSWYHSITFFNIANEVWLSVILSFIAEVGQASVLFAILLTKNKNRLLPWSIMIILTLLQVIGNVVSSYKFIQTSNSQDFTYFKDSILFWVETTEGSMFKIIIAWITGGILPVIALSMTALVAENLQLAEEELKETVQPKMTEIVEEIKQKEKEEKQVDDNINASHEPDPIIQALKEKEDLINTLKEEIKSISEANTEREDFKVKEAAEKELLNSPSSFDTNEWQHQLDDYYLSDLELDEILEREEMQEEESPEILPEISPEIIKQEEPEKQEKVLVEEVPEQIVVAPKEKPLKKKSEKKPPVEVKAVLKKPIKPKKA